MSIATSESILKILYSYNPWWRDGQIPKELIKPVKRLAFYEVLNIINHPQIRRYVILAGARRVGKTTILYQIIEDLINKGYNSKKIMYVSFDHPIFKFCTIEDILNTYELNISSSPDCYIFFDEIQYANNWDRWLKVFYDTKPKFKIVATGSASPVLIQGANESGVGRWAVLSIPTLSFYEYCDIVGIKEKPELSNDIKPTELVKLSPYELNEIMLKLVPLQKHFHRYLLVGGFPEFAFSDDIYYIQKVLREDVVDKVLKRDIPSLFNIRNSSVLEKVFLYLCFNSSNIINITKMSQEIENTSTITIENYIQFLESANLIYKSYPVGLMGKKVMKAKPKIYIADAAIRNAVLMLENPLADSKEMGIIVETTIYKHVKTFYYKINTNVGYFRQINGKQKEIDVVVDFPKGKILIEVKYRENTKIDQDDAIVSICKDNDNIAAFLITKNNDDFGIMPYSSKTPIMKIPAFAFLYMLGHAEKMGYFK